MTDRYNALIVVLDKDIREDDAEATIKAIEQIRGVASVTGNVSDISDHIAKDKAIQEIKNKIWELLK